MGDTHAPILGQAAGTYRELAVAPELRRHFASAWIHTTPRQATSQTAIVPDASADLVWFGGGLMVAGPDREVSLEPVPAGTAVVGLRFQPGAAAGWLGLPASEIVGQRIRLECLQAGQARELVDCVGEARDPGLILQRLEQGLSGMTAQMESPGAIWRAVLAHLHEAGEANGAMVRELASLLGMSERTLRRVCEQGFGYGPKTLDRILRMQRFLQAAGGGRKSNLAELALLVGYADQAHLTREARELTGLTPAAIQAQLTEKNEEGAGVFTTDALPGCPSE
jgi:AraC-like DNA-binding protein